MVFAMRRLLLVALFLSVFGLATPVQAYQPAPWSADGPSRGEDLHISLLTFGVGDDIASWFGHTALMVRDDRLGQERVYNYGMFSFGPDMLPKFLMGRLEFWVGEAPGRATLDLYESLNRDIYRSELNLLPDARREMAAFLAWNVLPENRDYLYHHYFDNCATRIRDAIDKAVSGQLAEAATVPSRTTLRGHTHRHTERNAYIDLLLSLWMNDEIDQPITAWEDMFLPGELLDQIEKLEYVDAAGTSRKLVVQTETVFESDRAKVPHMPSSKWWWTILIGLFLGGVGFVAARRWETTRKSSWRVLMGGHHFLVGMLFGIPGLVSVLFHFSDHTITFWNENMLLWSPLTFMALLLSVPIMRGSSWALRTMRICWYVMAATSVLAVVLKVLPAFDQDNLFALTMLVPFNLLMAAAMHRFGPPTQRGDLRELAPGVWTVASNRRFLDLEVGSRMTVVKLPDGKLWLHSPIALDPKLKAAIDELGEVAFLVGPNKFHHMHLGEWLAAYPEAKLHGAPGLAAQRSDLDGIVELTSDPVEAWAGALEHHVVAGAPMLNEVAFFHPATSTLIVADLLQNFASSDHFPTRIYLKLMGAERGCAVERVLRTAFRDKRAARASIDEILAWEFERITVCHGEVVNDDARSKFERAYQFLA